MLNARWRSLLCLGLLANLFAPLGCKEAQTLPPTYPVTGKVRLKNGAPLTEAGVHLTSLTDTRFVATGNVEKDGTFSLSTLTDQHKVKGVVEGAYTVRVTLPQGEDQAPPPTVRLTPGQFQVEAKDNQLVIEVEIVKDNPETLPENP